MLMRTLRSKVRWIMIAIVILFVLSIFGMYGFSGGGSRGSNQNSSEDYTVAEIDGKTVRRSQLESQLRQYVERTDARDITSADIPGLYQRTLENMAMVAMLQKEGEASGLKATEEEINVAVKEVSDQFPTKEAFMQYVDQSGIKMADFRKNMAEQIVQQKLMEKSIASIDPTDEEMKDFYEKTKMLFFHSPEGSTVDFLRVKNPETAEKFTSSLKEGTEWKDALQSVASADIVDKTPDTGPVFIASQGFNGPLAPLAELEPGAVSSPIEMASDDILVAVKRENVPEKTLAYDEVSGDVKGFLLDQKRREEQSKFFAGLLEKANIVIRDPSLFPKPEAPKAEDQKDAAVSADVQPPLSGDADGAKSADRVPPVSGDVAK
ncbi:MAG: hypothetical protein GX791_06230 [Synergistaceae bacterium]|nr:hypothetical protein [Synergistaceae bacterium]